MTEALGSRWLGPTVERFPRREKFLLGDRQRKRTCRAGERGGFRQRRGAVYRGDCSDDPSPQPSPSRGEGAKCRGNPLWLPGPVVARFWGCPALWLPGPGVARSWGCPVLWRPGPRVARSRSCPRALERFRLSGLFPQGSWSCWSSLLCPRPPGPRDSPQVDGLAPPINLRDFAHETNLVVREGISGGVTRRPAGWRWPRAGRQVILRGGACARAVRRIECAVR